jgi:hypothetical protein
VADQHDRARAVGHDREIDLDELVALLPAESRPVAAMTSAASSPAVPAPDQPMTGVSGVGTSPPQTGKARIRGPSGGQTGA